MEGDQKAGEDQNVSEELLNIRKMRVEKETEAKRQSIVLNQLKSGGSDARNAIQQRIAQFEQLNNDTTAKKTVAKAGPEGRQISSLLKRFGTDQQAAPVQPKVVVPRPYQRKAQNTGPQKTENETINATKPDEEKKVDSISNEPPIQTIQKLDEEKDKNIQAEPAPVQPNSPKTEEIEKKIEPSPIHSAKVDQIVKKIQSVPTKPNEENAPIESVPVQTISMKVDQIVKKILSPNQPDSSEEKGEEIDPSLVQPHSAKVDQIVKKIESIPNQPNPPEVEETIQSHSAIVDQFVKKIESIPIQPVPPKTEEREHKIAPFPVQSHSKVDQISSKIETVSIQPNSPKAEEIEKKVENSSPIQSIPDTSAKIESISIHPISPKAQETKENIQISNQPINSPVEENEKKIERDQIAKKIESINKTVESKEKKEDSKIDPIHSVNSAKVNQLVKKLENIPIKSPIQTGKFPKPLLKKIENEEHKIESPINSPKVEEIENQIENPLNESLPSPSRDEEKIPLENSPQVDQTEKKIDHPQLESFPTQLIISPTENEIINSPIKPTEEVTESKAAKEIFELTEKEREEQIKQLEEAIETQMEEVEGHILEEADYWRREAGKLTENVTVLESTTRQVEQVYQYSAMIQHVQNLEKEAKKMKKRSLLLRNDIAWLLTDENTEPTPLFPPLPEIHVLSDAHKIKDTDKLIDDALNELEKNLPDDKIDFRLSSSIPTFLKFKDDNDPLFSRAYLEVISLSIITEETYNDPLFDQALKEVLQVQ